MYGRTVALLFATTLLGFAGGIARYARGAGQAPAADQSLSHEERARLLAKARSFSSRGAPVATMSAATSR